VVKGIEMANLSELLELGAGPELDWAIARLRGWKIRELADGPALFGPSGDIVVSSAAFDVQTYIPQPSREYWAARDLAMLVGIEMYNDTSKLEICREWLKMELDQQAAFAGDMYLDVFEEE
jgi:hypothetical protein